MEFLKLLLYILIVANAIIICAMKNSRNMTNSLPYYELIPFHYDIRLITDIQANSVEFYGEYNATIHILTATHNIGVHLVGMVVDESAISLQRFFTGVTYRPSSTDYDSIIDMAHFIFDDELSPGIYVLYIKYVGISVKNLINSFYNTSYTSYTSTESGRVAFFNSPRKTKYMDEDGLMWTEFSTTPPIFTCLVVVVLTDLVQFRDVSHITNVWSRSHLSPYMQLAQIVAERIREYMVEHTGMSKQISKIDHFAIPNFAFIGLAFWGLIMYKEPYLTYDCTRNLLLRKRDVTKLIAHEVLHQWFGVGVHPARMSEKWLSEGIATFYEYYIPNEMYQEWRMIDYLVIEKLHKCLREDVAYIMNSIIPQISERNFRNHPIYDKPPVILRMLQHIITDEVFQSGIIRYLNTHFFKTATSDDLWFAMQVALNNSNVPHADFEIKAVMDTWINQIHYPLVTVTRNYETGETIISQEHFHLQGIDSDTDNKWWVPVTWTTEPNPNFSNTLPKRWLSPSNPNVSIDINPDDWIIVNLQQTGYYRVNYDLTNWASLVRYLNSENYTKIHVLNRAQIIDDAYVLMTTNQLDIATFIGLMNYLSRETDYIAWYPMFQALEGLSKYFPLPESATFKKHLSEILDNVLEITGYEEKPMEDDFTKLERRSTIKWACLVGNLKCQREANIKLGRRLLKVETHNVPNFWKEWIYCSGLMIADRIVWDRVMNLYMQKRDKKFLKYLACTEHTDFIYNYLDVIASNNMTLQDTDHIFALAQIIIKHARVTPVLDYMLKNLDRIKPKSFTTVQMLREIIFNVYNEDQLDKIRDFVKNNFDEKILASILLVIDSRVLAVRNLLDNFLR